MPRSKSPADPFEPLDDAFDVPAFVVPPRPVSSPRRPQANRPATESRPQSNPPRPASAPRTPAPANPRPLPPAPRIPASRGVQPSLFSSNPLQKLRPVHFQIGGVLLVALCAILEWNARSPRTDGVFPHFGLLLLREVFGFGAPLVPLAGAAFGCVLIAKGKRARVGAFWRGAALLFVAVLALRHLGVPRGSEFVSAQVLSSHGGLVGAAVAWVLRRLVGEVGAYIALASLALVSLLLWSENSLDSIKQRISDGWGDLRYKWQTGRTKPRASKRQPEADWRLEDLARDETPRPQTPRKVAPVTPQVAAPSPFLEVGDWFGPPDEAEEKLDRGNLSPIQKNVSPGKENLSPCQENDSPGKESLPPDQKILPPGQKKLSPSLENEAPRIEIIQPELPVSVLDAQESEEEVLLPHESLELQALESAQDDFDVPKPAPRIEKPRRRFGDGPLMPEYFDDGVRALDPPVLPDLEGAEEELQRGVIGVQETLAAFKIDARVTDVKRGPVITRYEVQPAPGVRVAAIANLDKDLARSLSALAVRIEAPVPGKNVVGIEVPNKRVHLVRMRDVLEQTDFLAHPSKLAFVLGKDIAGQPKWGDLGKMPHLLIAGSTNSGKSVCLNSIIASILVRCGPEDVRFSLIDPKRVELTLYRGIPHLMHDVVVEPKQAVVALRRAIEEMDRRYRLFASRGVRNIASYNGKLNEGERPMPYIVIVIDELADLMMTAAAEFEKLICRLAQLARATGIHLIVATQRPSVNVITGVIKANIPARIAFAVASQVDSRTILDSVGAERLIGSGDMLFDANNGGKSVRIQGAFLSEEEVNRIVEVVKANYQHEDSVPDDLPTFDLFVEEEDDGDDAKSGGFSSDEKRDSLYDDIVEFCLRHNEMSASNIQRKFGIGYPRAGRIVDQLERAGVLSPADGPKPRKVLGRGEGGEE